MVASSFYYYLGGPVFALLPEWPKVISFSLLSASSVRCMCDHERRRGAPVPAALCPNNSRAECGLRSASSTARQGCVYALNVPHIARRVMQEDLCAGHTMAHGHRNVPDPNCPEPQASQQICLMQVTHRDKNIFSPHCFEKVA